MGLTLLFCLHDFFQKNLVILAQSVKQSRKKKKIIFNLCSLSWVDIGIKFLGKRGFSQRGLVIKFFYLRSGGFPFRIQVRGNLCQK